WWCRRSVARQEWIPRVMPGRTLRTRTASGNCLARCAGRKARTGRLDLFAWWPRLNQAECAGCFPHRRKEFFWRSREGRTDSAMIRFSTSLLSEKRMRKFRAKKKTCTAIVGKRFTRRSISFWARGQPEEIELQQECQ